jgi:hypothetical protein
VVLKKLYKRPALITILEIKSIPQDTTSHPLRLLLYDRDKRDREHQKLRVQG